MRLLSTAALLSFCLMSVAPAQAQDPPAGGGSSQPQANQGASSESSGAEASEASKGARDAAQAWIRKQGYTVGLDKNSGTIVVVGSAGYDHTRGGAVARRDAFARASTDAKEQIASFLAAEISSYVSQESVGGKLPESTSAIPEEDLRAFVDAMKRLKASGNSYSVDEATSIARTFARAQVCGLTASNAFFGTAPNGSGSFAVVMRASKASLAQARSAVLVAAKPPTSNVPLVAGSWLEQMNDDDLFNCFGVRIFRESEDSDSLCLLAFGQADINGGGESAQTHAEGAARSNAEQALRQFVGEYFLGARVLLNSSRIEELKNDQTSFEYSEAFRQRTVRIAEGLGVSGGFLIRRWSGQAGKAEDSKPTAGVVLKWSVRDSDSASEFGKEMEQVGGAAGGRGRLDASPRETATPSRGSQPKLPSHKPINPGNQGPTTPEP